MPTTRRRMLTAAASLLASPALAQAPSFTLTMRDRKFDPAELMVPAGEKFELRITNAESVNLEFESSDLRREKVVPRGQTVTLYLGPLRPGRYEFWDDYRPQIRGVIIAR